MSQARITLRPPPNVEFVQGYPGIPPAGHERPHAEVRGSIELRLGAHGVKAKWVRVELRKVETLPGGGQANTFYDFVGPSPVKVWEAEGEWSWLHTQDFPFSIRIPESIPPSIALERSAGIKYELIATLCMKGKKGVFRKAATPILSTMTPIIIDKHELHSTWPVYAQPESRHVVDELLILTVDRTHTCYGPGDRVKVMATFKNDGVTVAVLRAFEFLLKETVIFRAGPHVSGKKGAPQVHVSPIGEQKVPVNATVYGGQQHRAELGCFIPQTHTTTTVNAARHIDIAYSITVKAVLATGKPLLMDLPVTVSNWPRNMSVEAVRRIGHSPNLSLIAANQSHMGTIPRPQPDTVAPTRPSAMPNGNQTSGYSTTMASAFQMRPHQISERVEQHPGGIKVVNASSLPTNQYGDQRPGSQRGYDEFGFPLAGGSSTQQQVNQPATYNGYISPPKVDAYSAEARQRPPVNTTPGKRLTLVNAALDSEPESPPAEASSPAKFMTAAEEKKQLQDSLRNGPGGSSSSSGGQSSVQPPVPASVPATAPSSARTGSSHSRTAWPTAEEEKQRLFEEARKRALETQASMGNPIAPMPAATEPPSSKPAIAVAMPVAKPAPAPTSKQKNTPWPTAEEEKLRLFNEAQNAARRTQTEALAGGSTGAFAGGSGLGGGSPPATRTEFVERQTSFDASGGSSSSRPINDSPRQAYTQARPLESKSAGAQLYQHAMAAVSRTTSAQASNVKLMTPPSPPAQKLSQSPPASRTRFPTAEEEKAAMRYYEAKRAVDRHQNIGDHQKQSSISSLPADEPIAYDALYPAGPSSGQTRPSQAANGSAPGSSSVQARNSASDHVASGSSRHRTTNSLSNGNGSFLPSVTPPDSPPPPPLAPDSVGDSALSEKERLRLKYAAEDAAASMAGPPPSPPPRTSTSGNPPMYGGPPPRSQPLPPVSSSAPRQLTAAEEKARLRAQYEAEDTAVASGSQANGAGSSDVPRPVVSPGFNNGVFIAPPPPPPLAPRPPVEYIQETQEEDARTQAEDHVYSSIDATMSGSSLYKSNGNGNGVDDSRMDFGLSFRPFSPLDLGVNFDVPDKTQRTGTSQISQHTSPPPPLPPKVPVFE